MRSWLTPAVVVLSLSLSSAAWAQDKNRIALIDLEISGDGPPELRQNLQKHISDGLASEGYEVTNLEQTLKILKGVPELIGCSSTACLERIFELIPANHFVRAVVTASGANYEIQLELLSALDDQSVVNTVAESCAVCTITELNVMAADAARKLLKPNTEQTLKVEIATDPPGATIIIDGVEMGESPLYTDLKVGSHTINATRDGHANSEKTIDVQADASHEQRFELVLPADSAMKIQEPHESPKDYGASKWIALGGSTTLLTLGTVLVAIDGDPSCSSNTATCPNFRKTLTGGIISLSGGVLLGALSGWMFWQESSSASSKSSVSVHATKGGGIAGYSYRF